MQGASAFLLGNRVCLHSESRTVHGLWIAQKPVVCVDNLDDVAAIGEAIEEVLAAARTGVPHPDVWGSMWEQFGFFLKAAKVRSWRALVDSSRHVSIKRDGTTIDLAPSYREGRSFAYFPDDRNITLEGPQSAELGTALLRAFERCE